MINKKTVFLVSGVGTLVFILGSLFSALSTMDSSPATFVNDALICGTYHEACGHLIWDAFAPVLANFFVVGLVMLIGYKIRDRVFREWLVVVALSFLVEIALSILALIFRNPEINFLSVVSPLLFGLVSLLFISIRSYFAWKQNIVA